MQSQIIGQLQAAVYQIRVEYGSPVEIIVYLKASGYVVLILTSQKIALVPLLWKKRSRGLIHIQVSSSRTPVLVTDLQHVRLCLRDPRCSSIQVRSSEPPPVTTTQQFCYPSVERDGEYKVNYETTEAYRNKKTLNIQIL